MKPSPAYVPALGFHWLTALYDPLIRGWTGATRIRASVIDALALQPGMRILELGAGPGRLAIQIKRAFPDVKVDAVDIDARMIASAKRNAASAGVDIEFREADMTQLPDAGSYDRIYSTMTFHHLSPAAKQEALAIAHRALARTGDSRFVLADFSRPRDPLQWALFSWIQQPLDGFENTRPHRTGHFEAALRTTFSDVRSSAVRRTIAGTIETFVCRP